MAVAPLVSIVMGSKSDLATMQHAADTLTLLRVPFEMRVVSAHRMPVRMMEFAQQAERSGVKVIIAGAGGAAHLPGMIAALTMLPVLGVPIQSRALRGLDSLLSIVQMPGGVPVGTMAIGKSGAVNAGLFAASILGMIDSDILERYRAHRARITELAAGEKLERAEPKGKVV